MHVKYLINSLTYIQSCSCAYIFRERWFYEVCPRLPWEIHFENSNRWPPSADGRSYKILTDSGPPPPPPTTPLHLSFFVRTEKSTQTNALDKSQDAPTVNYDRSTALETRSKSLMVVPSSDRTLYLLKSKLTLAEETQGRKLREETLKKRYKGNQKRDRSELIKELGWDPDFFGIGLTLTDIRSLGKIYLRRVHYRLIYLRNNLIGKGIQNLQTFLETKRIESCHSILAICFRILNSIYVQSLSCWTAKPWTCSDSDKQIYSLLVRKVPRFL